MIKQIDSRFHACICPVIDNNFFSKWSVDPLRSTASLKCYDEIQDQYKLAQINEKLNMSICQKKKKYLWEYVIV